MQHGSPTGRLVWADVVERAAAVARSYRGRATLRQVFYRLASLGVIPNTPVAYRTLSSRTAQARREGRFPDLVDNERRIHVADSWADAGAFVREVPEFFRLDRTRGQRVAVYLGVEKDTLRSLFTDWVGELGIPVLVMRGYSSQTYVKDVRHRALAEGRARLLLAFTDFDSSGEDIERDWVERTGCWDRVERVLLTNEQRLAYGLPATEGKRHDPRWPRFAAKYGFDVDNPVQWEIEALDPDELQRLVLAAVAPYVDRRVLADVLADEQRQRDQLAAFLDRWPPTT